MNELPSRITDEEITRLPLSHGRGELLEEIMSTHTDLTPHRDELATRRTRRRSWLAAGGAAAAVAALAGVVLLPQLGGDEKPREAAPAIGGSLSASPQAQALGTIDVRSVPGGTYFALSAAGWRLDSLSSTEGLVDATWINGDQSFSAVTYRAADYQDYFEDRDSQVGVEASGGFGDELAPSTGGSAPLQEAPGDTIVEESEESEPMRRIGESTLLGQDAMTWAYTDTDHATMRTPEGEVFVEVRADGMALAEYQALLDTLVQTDAVGFETAFEDQLVTTDERAATIDQMLRGVPLPEGFTPDDVHLTLPASTYHATADIAGSVACAWADQYFDGDAAQKREALAELDGSTQWQMLRDIDDEGDYPEAIWEISDQLRNGLSRQDVALGIGCS